MRSGESGGEHQGEHQGERQGQHGGARPFGRGAPTFRGLRRTAAGSAALVTALASGLASALAPLRWPRVVLASAGVGAGIYVAILLSVFLFVSLFSTLGLEGPTGAQLDLWVSFVGAWGAWAAFCAMAAFAARWAAQRAGEFPVWHGATTGALSAVAAWAAVNYRYGRPEFWELAVFLALGLGAGGLGGLWGGQEQRKEEELLRADGAIGVARDPQGIAEAVGTHLADRGVAAVALWLAGTGAAGGGLLGNMGRGARDALPGPLSLGGTWSPEKDAEAPVRASLDPSRTAALARMLVPLAGPGDRGGGPGENPAAGPPAALLDPGALPAGSWPLARPAPSAVLAVALRHPDAPPDLMLVALRRPGFSRRLRSPALRGYLRVAAHAATRLEALGLMEEGRSEGGLVERQRMQHELHDSIAQGLISIVHSLDRGPGDAERAHALTTARELLADVRRVVKALDTPALRAGLRPALADLARDLEEQTGVRAWADTVGDARGLPRKIEAAVYWVAHEATQNIRKHAAGAGRAKLTLSYLPDAVVLDVRDDGPGFDPSKPREAAEDPLAPGGTGLRAWSQSVERLGGTLDVQSAPGEGTTLTVRLPTRPALVRRGAGGKAAS